MWEGLAHCWWCHPWAGGPRFYKKAGWASHNEQDCKQNFTIAVSNCARLYVNACMWRLLQFLPCLNSCSDFLPWREKALFGLHFHITIHHQRKSEQELTQGRNLETGVNSQVMRGAAYWLVTHGLCSLLIKTRSTNPKVANRLGSPTSLTKKMVFRVWP